ncbi:MAG: hypothetical protein QOJ03_1887 [Frankiaceae bacterium]|jgi:hypothetical protein|nr:hypothetical protein [Frankiaceae bacterium]
MLTTAKIAAAGVAVVIGVTGIVAGSTGAGGATVTRGATAVDPANFTNPKSNPYYPLQPGTVSHYRGSDDGAVLHERVTVTHRTKLIQGVRTKVIHDVLRRADGTVAEATHDWYADDNAGNVWYFGEATATYDRQGHVKSRDGSWQSGVKGARAGLIMPANPHPTDAYRQEFWAGHAEDQAWIVQRRATTTVPYGTLHHVVRSFEWTRLEAHVVSVKFYAPGLGIVREHDVAGGTEIFELVSVTHN